MAIITIGCRPGESLFMKFFVLFALVTVLAGVQTASAQIGLKPNQTSDLVCVFNKPIGKMKDGSPVFTCATQASQVYGFALTGVRMTTSQASRPSGNADWFKIHCTNANPAGIYVYGGDTVGFKSQKFFYATGDRTQSGRCFVTGDTGVLARAGLVVNQSALAILSLQPKASDSVAR